MAAFPTTSLVAPARVPVATLRTRGRLPGGAQSSRPPVIRLLKPLAVLAAGVLTACSNSETFGGGQSTAQPSVTQDAATRSAPVVAGRPARVFIFAGLGNKCEALPPPQVAIVQQPSKGALSLVQNQETTIGTSAKGTCIGHAAKGTAVYYTAREGVDGTDRFAVSAKLGGGEEVTRTFEVTIAQ